MNPSVVLFSRNAEKIIHSTYDSSSGVPLKTERKPDVILTTIHAASRYYGIESRAAKLYETATQQPPNAFTWHDILSFVEFKIYNHAALSALPSKYDTTLREKYSTIEDIYWRGATPRLKETEQAPVVSKPPKRAKKEHSAASHGVPSDGSKISAPKRHARYD